LALKTASAIRDRPAFSTQTKRTVFSGIVQQQSSQQPLQQVDGSQQQLVASQHFLGMVTSTTSFSEVLISHHYVRAKYGGMLPG
jgi:hypothetical protein